MPILRNRKKTQASVTPKSAREKAYSALQQKVLAGEIPAGSALSEASLARELGISRTPLREAVGQLIAQGFLRSIPNRGTVVVEFAKRDIGELYDLREALELYAVGKAAAGAIRAADMDELIQLADQVLTLRTELLRTGRPHLSAAQMQRFLEMDLTYHAQLMRLADNLRLMKAVGDARILLNVFAIRRRGHDLRVLEQIHRYHRGVLDAVIRQDAAEAQRLLGEHIRLSKEERLQEYDSMERERARLHAISSWPVAGEPGEE